MRSGQDTEGCAGHASVRRFAATRSDRDKAVRELAAQPTIPDGAYAELKQGPDNEQGIDLPGVILFYYGMVRLRGGVADRGRRGLSGRFCGSFRWAYETRLLRAGPGPTTLPLLNYCLHTTRCPPVPAYKIIFLATSSSIANVLTCPESVSFRVFPDSSYLRSVVCPSLDAMLRAPSR